MSLLWRRATIALLVATGALAAVRAALQPVDAALAVAWAGFGAFLALACLGWYDGRRIGHVTVFGASALVLAGSHWMVPGVGWAVAMAVTGVAATLAGTIAWLIREVDRPPSLADYYAAAVKARRIRESADQLEVVGQLDDLAARFRRYERQRRLPWAFLLQPPRGVYLFGPAGRGKSFLLDGMFDTLPSRSKRRFHFHELMVAVTDELHRLQGVRRPFRRVARQLAPRASLVLIDEINLIDTNTVQLFAPLLMAWWQSGCVVCMSSNQRPENLFEHLAERAQLDAALRRGSRIVQMPGEIDFRWGKLTARDLYQHPCGPRADRRIAEIVAALAESEVGSGEIEINGRRIVSRANAVGVAWFDFDDLCRTATGYRDYIELVARYANVAVSNVPALAELESARRFSWLVELVYDRRRRLILSAEVPCNRLFVALPVVADHEMDFEKIASRLAEMQSTEYIYALSAEG